MKFFPTYVIEPEFDKWYKDLTNDKELIELSKDICTFYKKLLEKFEA